MASEGVILSNYFSHEVCTPSRAAFMTGRYALRFGMHGGAMDDKLLPSSEYTVAEELRSAGYKNCE